MGLPGLGGAWSGGGYAPRGAWSGGCLFRGDAWSRGGLVWGVPGPGGPGPGGVCSQRGVGIPTCTEADPPPPRETATAADGTVRILLECFLVTTMFDLSYYPKARLT